MQNETNSGISSAEVRTELDNILMEHLERLSKTTTVVSTLELDLITIACLQLMVERENEIKVDSSVNHYTRETFLKDLTDIGLEMDDELMGVFQILVMYNYVEMKDNHYYPRKAAFEQVKYLDKMFPGMPGMNLVAYFLQMIEEVTSNRKSFEDAKAHFDQTLHNRSKGVYKNQYRQVTLESSVTLKKKKAANEAEALKLNFREKLARLRNTSNNKSGSVYTKSAYAAKHVKIKEIFTENLNYENKVENIELDKFNPDVYGREEIKEDNSLPEAETVNTEEAKAIEEEEQRLLEEFKKREAELVKRIEELEKRTVEEKTIGDLVDERENEPEPELDEEEEEAELSIEERIAAFEREMAMTCPLCGEGKINEGETEKGQVYHSCTNSSCQFISWSKPYRFSCPKCQNNFLIETTGDDGEPGLKCPRSSCTFTQNGLSDPADMAAKKKKRVVVRRRKKK